ncbi:RecX family transcriptional regulator [Paenibacillus sp. MMS18-CY102]|uniref:RecX family transcriptional regulator n=1 Tax=Paenibacillus sp. MMS18-CY102 TaxID=2682849 RepID=UPI001365D0FA|nr:RecX family transcriptional regulator [Paenibacillus sp. MMS18-CY102]MWC26494.1 RecX family transcriptional regulator [Paenibacillus sp. MMS18-CY102]
MSYTIRSVEQDRKQRRRYLIYVDQAEDSMFSVHEDLLIRHRLFKGLEITDQMIEDIVAEDDRYRAYALAIYYLGARPRTAKEIERYLLRKELEGEPIAYAIERLQQERLVDDVDYAKRFAESRLRSSGKGRLYIQQELKMRGVDKHTADQAAAGLSKETEQAAADQAAMKRWRSLSGETYEKRRKLAQFLLRRGYPMEVSMAAVKRAMAQSNEQDDGEDVVWLDN